MMLAARQTSLGLLARREHSRKELARKLMQRGIESEVANEVLDGLQHEGLLSEERFANCYVEMRVAKGYGPARIGQELRERGIDDQLISRELYEVEIDWAAQLRSVNAKKYGAIEAEDFKERARRARFFQYRGFTAEQIQHVLRNGYET